MCSTRTILAVLAFISSSPGLAHPHNLPMGVANNNNNTPHVESTNTITNSTTLLPASIKSTRQKRSDWEWLFKWGGPLELQCFPDLNDAGCGAVENKRGVQEAIAEFCGRVDIGQGLVKEQGRFTAAIPLRHDRDEDAVLFARVEPVQDEDERQCDWKARNLGAPYTAPVYGTPITCEQLLSAAWRDCGNHGHGGEVIVNGCVKYTVHTLSRPWRGGPCAGSS